MNYQEAKTIRKLGLSGLLAMDAGSGRSTMGTFSDSMRASVKGVQQIVDPLNIAKKLTFGSNLAPALLGKLTGRSKEDIDFFSTRKKGKNTDPMHTMISVGSLQTIRSNDAVSDVAAKIFNFMYKDNEKDMRQHEIESLFYEEREQERDHRHQEFLRAIRGENVTATKIKRKTGKISPKFKSVLGVGGLLFTTLAMSKVFETATEEVNKEIDIKIAKLPNIDYEKTLWDKLIQEFNSIFDIFDKEPADKYKIPEVDIGDRRSIAAISIRGETGATTKEGALKKVGQIVKDKGGGYSYGLFGMNSQAGVVQQFVRENPQLGIDAKADSTEFMNQWKKAAETYPDAFYDAQLSWHDKHILRPTQQALEANPDIPLNVRNSPMVLAYMSDRRVHMHSIGEKSLIASMSGVSSPEDFVKRAVEFDKRTVPLYFPKAIKESKAQGGDITEALRSRIDIRGRMALQFAPLAMPVTATPITSPPAVSGDSLISMLNTNKQLLDEFSSEISGLSVIDMSNNSQIIQKAPDTVLRVPETHPMIGR